MKQLFKFNLYDYPILREHILPSLLLVGVVVLMVMCADTNLKYMRQWPEELDKEPCNLLNYQTCKETDWFIISGLELPQMVSTSGKHKARSALIIPNVKPVALLQDS